MNIFYLKRHETNSSLLKGQGHCVAFYSSFQIMIYPVIVVTNNKQSSHVFMNVNKARGMVLITNKVVNVFPDNVTSTQR